MPTPEWIGEQGFTHADLTTPEAEASMSKYETREAFDVGAVNAMRSVGSPFRLPKSLESLPDDVVRKDFTDQVAKLQSSVPYDAEALESVNYAEGLANADNVQQEIVTAFKELATERKFSKEDVQALVKFSNGISQKGTIASDKDDTDRITNTTEVYNGLYGGEEGVKTHKVLVERLMHQHGGLTAEEHEALAPIVASGISRNGVLGKALFNMAKKLVKEGDTEDANAQATKKKEQSNLDRNLPNLTKELWG